jgi:tetratricopeptide (TPR) repeat protein
MAGMLRLTCVFMLVVSAPALALDDPDTEVARRHFEKGRGFYDAKDYRHALDEFQAARRAKAAPGLDYNIARCYDRLEDYRSAVRHYQLYLDAKPDAPVLLPSTLDVTQPPLLQGQDEGERARRRRNGAIVGGVVAGAVVVATAVLLGVFLGQGSSPSFTRSDLGPFEATR